MPFPGCLVLHACKEQVEKFSIIKGFAHHEVGCPPLAFQTFKSYQGLEKPPKVFQGLSTIPWV